MRRVMAQVDRVAASEARVCILGETGTGKELIARALHDRSQRRDGPFVTLNCAAVPAELIESELFGHEKGSFTGAVSRHIGKFEQANHGTLFLDEIGDMPAGDAGQAAARSRRETGGAYRRRPLHSGGRARDGGHPPQSGRDGRSAASFARISTIASTSFRCCCRPCASGRKISPRWWTTSRAQVAERTAGSPSHCRPQPSRSLPRYAWPGNVRELRNVVERLLLLAGRRSGRGNRTPGSAPDAATASLAPPGSGTLAARTEAFEREVILAELKRTISA